MTVLQVTVDMSFSVVHCAGILYVQKKQSDRTTLAADLEVITADKLKRIKSKARTLKAFKKLIVSNSNREVLKKVNLASCLNPNKSNYLLSKFQA